MLRSTQPPILSGTGNELLGQDIVWLTGAVVCLCTAPLVQLFTSAIMRCGSSCQSAATSEIVKRCWRQVVYISGAIATSRAFTFDITACQYLGAFPGHQLIRYHIYRTLHVCLFVVLHRNQKNSEICAAEIERQEATAFCQSTTNLRLPVI